MKTTLLIISATLGLFASQARADRLTIKGSDTLGAKLVPQLAEAFKAHRLEERHLTEKFGSAYPDYRDGRGPAVRRGFSVARAVGNREHKAVLGLLVVLALLWWKIL